MPNISARPKGYSADNKARRDPSFRPTTGGFYEAKLTNKDPSKAYVVSDPTLKDIYNGYLNMGWRPVVSSPTSPTFVAGITSQPGQIVEFMGGHLLEIDKNIKEEMERDGRDYANRRLAEVRKARSRHWQKTGQDCRNSVGDGVEVEITELDIPPRGRD